MKEQLLASPAHCNVLLTMAAPSSKPLIRPLALSQSSAAVTAARGVKKEGNNVFLSSSQSVWLSYSEH